MGAVLSGGTIVLKDGQERALAGLDGEVGYRLPVFTPGEIDLRIYGGAFHFEDSQVAPVQGPRGRVELRFYDIFGRGGDSRLTLGAEVQHDDVRGSQALVSLRLRIPLQIFASATTPLSPIERRMVDPIERDIDVVTQAGAFGKAQAAINVATGQTIGAAMIAGAGTNLRTAAAGLGANSVLIVDGHFGPVDTTSGVVQLQSGQTLMGGGSQLLVRGAVTGQSAVFNAPGSRPTLATAGAGSDVLSLAVNSTVTGVNLTGGFKSIFVNNANNAHVINVTATGPSRDGIDIETSSGVTVSGFSVANAGGRGIFANGSDNLGLSNVNIAGTQQEGIAASGFTGMTMTNVSIRNSFLSGVAVTNGTNIAINATVTNPGADGIRLIGAINNLSGTSTASGLSVGASACGNLAAVIGSTLVVNGVPCP